MGTYRNTCAECDSAYETDSWEPERCPVCEVERLRAENERLRRDAALGAKVRDAVGVWASDPSRIAMHEELRVTDEGEPDRHRDVFVVDDEQVDILGAIADALREEAGHG